MISLFRRLLGYDDRFYDLLEASAAEARGSTKLLVQMLKDPQQLPSLDDFVQSRRKEKRITEEITEQLCKTFVTPLEREDIEALARALYRVPKTAEKFGERFLLCRERVQTADFSRHIQLLEQATETVEQMVRALRSKANAEKVKEQNDRLHFLEGEGDKLMLVLVKDLYSGRHDALTVVIVLDLYELLEKVIDRCRDAGNIVLQIVLKYS